MESTNDLEILFLHFSIYNIQKEEYHMSIETRGIPTQACLQTFSIDIVSSSILGLIAITVSQHNFKVSIHFLRTFEGQKHWTKHKESVYLNVKEWMK